MLALRLGEWTQAKLTDAGYIRHTSAQCNMRLTYVKGEHRQIRLENVDMYLCELAAAHHKPGSQFMIHVERH